MHERSYVYNTTVSGFVRELENERNKALKMCT